MKATDVAYIGLRCVDSFEREVIADLEMHSFSMTEVDEFGIKDVVKRALRSINPNNDRPLHVSFDIDVIDPIEAPATGTPGWKKMSLFH